MRQQRGDEIRHMERILAVDRRTLPPDGGYEYNRLIFETSPYLLQHADNPVDWYAWGEEAFERAASEDKPIFLSIGYATCHWCHVMAHESFEQIDVAEVFNRHFICIKVDREERPDIDEQYMAVAQMMTGSGGWPLSIFMTPEKKPFFAMTYIPKVPQHGLPGIVAILERVAELWHSDREKLEESSVAVLEAVGRLFQPASGTLSDTTIAAACQQLTEMYDGFWGGFGSAPKFPMPVYLQFLLRQGQPADQNQAASAMVEHTLRMLRQGGIYDQIGYGFHRYSVGRDWLVPHFEKMLYDQALMAMTYLEAYQKTGNPFYGQVAEEIFSHVSNDMTSPEGGFYSGLDADSEGEEGKCYLWNPAEIAAVIGTDGADIFCRLFDVTENGNFEGRNILHLLVAPEVFAAREGLQLESLQENLKQWRQALQEARQRRPQPFRDQKVLTSWNGLMIAAFARGYAITGKDRYLLAAARGAGFIGKHLVSPGGRLLRSYHLGKAAVSGFLEDYAFFAWGLIELHQATLEPAFLEGAITISREMLRLFKGAGEGLYETGHDAEKLPVRRKSAYDGALPSGNGIAALNLIRLGRIADDISFIEEGRKIIEAFMGDVDRQPLASLNLLSAHGYFQTPETLITLTGGREAMGPLLRGIHTRFLPHLAIRHAGTESSDFPTIGGRPTAYLCAAGTCRPPVTEPERLRELLAGL